MKRLAFVVLLFMFITVVFFQVDARMMTDVEILNYPKFVPMLNEDRRKSQESLDTELINYAKNNDDDTLYPLTGFLDSVNFDTGKIVLMSRWAPIKIVYIYFDTKDSEFVNQLKKIANKRNSDGALSGVQVGIFLTADNKEDTGFRATAKFVRVLVGEK